MTNREKFLVFHAAHPEVYEEIERRVNQLIAAGWSEYSMKTLYCVIRFETDVGAGPSEAAFKLDDRYHSHYARMVVSKGGPYAHFFKLRQLRTP